MTTVLEEMKTNWTSADFYNFEDLNRVEAMTKLTNDKLLEFYGENLALTHNYARTELSIEFADSLNRIENNIAQIRVACGQPNSTIEPKIDWTYNTPFTFADANRLENNLYHLYQYLDLNLANIPYCGEFTVGQQGVF